MGFTALKIAVVAPMPNANVRIAIKVKPGCFKRFLIAKRISLIIESTNRLQLVTLNFHARSGALRNSKPQPGLAIRSAAPRADRPSWRDAPADNKPAER